MNPKLLTKKCLLIIFVSIISIWIQGGFQSNNTFALTEKNDTQETMEKSNQHSKGKVDTTPYIIVAVTGGVAAIIFTIIMTTNYSSKK